MDTKWKNRKKGISFMIFFAGVSLTLGSSISLLQNLPRDFSWRHPSSILQEDYQQSGRFREYMCSRLETFLAMATNSFGGDYYNCYDYYDYYGYADSAQSVVEDEVITSFQNAIPWDEILWEGTAAEEFEEYLDYLDWYSSEIGVESGYGWQNRESSLTEEQRKQRDEQRRKAAQQYHDNIKRDENLLYSIAYDGKVLYSNSDLLPTDGSMTAPEGYNFLLQYADGKVRIFKDGKELDIYGDGYYRDSDEWYVPGYRNFTVDEDMKKAVICMAVAREPVLYTESSYSRGNYRQMDNSLYWMRTNTLMRKETLMQNMVGLAAGLALLAMAFLCRRSKREADAGIARFTGKIWFEGKILLLGIILYILLYLWVKRIFWNYGPS
ncbi:MAG: hypothetical protein K2O34_09460, partial [Acetatifactor sp.]|nr:hypothetical protein [Acetatifactor sp.]